MWGTSPLQRLRLAPLYLALRLADVWPTGHHAAAGTRSVPWLPGLSVVIPDRDAPEMLSDALTSLHEALARVDEPHQVIVVANGAPENRYRDIRAAFPSVEIVHSAEPLGFSTAIGRGLARATHAWTFLMNNDVTLDADALRLLASHRSDTAFSLSAQIFQRSQDGRREETGFTDWYIDTGGVHVYHAQPPIDGDVHPHLAGSGGATLFRSDALARYVEASHCYDPFYWEDIEWGVRAWREGQQVLFCGSAHAFHRHRATTSRFFAADEIDRIVARNAVLFDARNRASPFDAGWLMSRVCDQPRSSQRQLARMQVAADVAQHRMRAPRSSALPMPPALRDPRRPVTSITRSSFSYRFRDPPAKSERARPRMLIVSPFAVYPPRHGGARRIAGLMGHLRRDYDIVLVSDEASLYDARSFASFDGLCGLYLVQRDNDKAALASAPIDVRMRTHGHHAMRDAVARAIARHDPDVIQVEHAELAELVKLRGDGQHWILDLHDACLPDDFSSPADAGRFNDEILPSYDAVLVCSDEDAVLTSHRRMVRVPNASGIDLDGYRPSSSAQILFLGPFRYAQNHLGVRQFLQRAFPAIRAQVPHANLLVLGGDEAPRVIEGDAAFAQPGVQIVPHRDDVRALLDASALTINPLTQIRGSSIKVIESLTAGRICVSTREGARGFLDEGLAGLVVVDDIASMAAPVAELLADTERRHRMEAPDVANLRRFQWSRSAELLGAVCVDLLRDRHE